MDQPEEGKNEDIRSFLSQIAGVDFTIVQRRPNRRDKAYMLFKSMINTLEMINTRSVILERDLQINFDDYDTLFYEFIDIALTTQFGANGREIILFYLDRFDDNGDIIPMPIATGEYVLLQSVNELWYILHAIRDEKETKPKASNRSAGTRRGTPKKNPSGDSGEGSPDDPVKST